MKIREAVQLVFRPGAVSIENTQRFQLIVWQVGKIDSVCVLFANRFRFQNWRLPRRGIAACGPLVEVCCKSRWRVVIGRSWRVGFEEFAAVHECSVKLRLCLGTRGRGPHVFLDEVEPRRRLSGSSSVGRGFGRRCGRRQG